MTSESICQGCFALILAIGIGCMIGGPLLDEAVKAARLDNVLTPEELADESLRDRTRVLIDRTAKQYWPIWIGLGAILTAVGIVGLRANTMRSVPTR